MDTDVKLFISAESDRRERVLPHRPHNTTKQRRPFAILQQRVPTLFHNVTVQVVLENHYCCMCWNGRNGHRQLLFISRSLSTNYF